MITDTQVFRRLQDLHRRLFAWFMDRASGPYERLVEARKEALLVDLRGTVVEIGPGTGPNLRYMPADARVVGLEPNRHMHPYLRSEARRLERSIDIRHGRAESMALSDACADTVVSTLVLCSVESEDPALSEILRILKPGGRLVFLEHVAAPRGSWLRRVQRWVRPVWKTLGDGCRPDRDIGERIRAAGFQRVEMESFRLPLPVVSPHVAGTAWKARE